MCNGLRLSGTMRGEALSRSFEICVLAEYFAPFFQGEIEGRAAIPEFLSEAVQVGLHIGEVGSIFIVEDFVEFGFGFLVDVEGYGLGRSQAVELGVYGARGGKCREPRHEGKWRGLDHLPSLLTSSIVTVVR